MKGLGLIDMIRSVALSEMQDDEGASEWMDTYFNHPFITGLLAPSFKKRWGVSDEWFKERFVFGDTEVDQVVADLEEFTGEDDLSTQVGELASDLASQIVKRRRDELGQEFGQK